MMVPFCFVEGAPILNRKERCRKCGGELAVIDWHVNTELGADNKPFAYEWLDVCCAECNAWFTRRPLDSGRGKAKNSHDRPARP